MSLITEQLTELTEKLTSFTPRTILVVDGFQGWCTMIKSALIDRGYEHVYTTTSGDEGLVLLQKHRPHVIIIDLILDGMSGLEFIALGKMVSPMSRYILLSGFTTKENLIMAIHLGVHGFIEKSDTLDPILKVVERNLRALPGEDGWGA